MLNIKENTKMNNNLETRIEYEANGDGGYILSQNYC